MAMELKHLNPQHVMDVTGKAIDEISRLRAENAELKAKLEDAKATAYAESVDAGMRERRLKRALWLARAYIMELLQRDFQRIAYTTNSESVKSDLISKRNKFYEHKEYFIKKAEEYK